MGAGEGGVSFVGLFLTQAKTIAFWEVSRCFKGIELFVFRGECPEVKVMSAEL